MKETKPCIMVVDDTPANLHLLGQILKRHEYDVRLLPDGESALSSARTKPPDLVLLDIRMPGMTGYGVCQNLKADAKTRDIPIIFISALREPIDKVKAFSMGGVDYVSKPFQEEEVLARVHTHLKLASLRKKIEKQNASLKEEIHYRMVAEEKLRKSNDELEGLVQLRTAELVTANSELENAWKAAEAGSRAKSEFLANISHELKTPLNPVIAGMGLVLKMADLGPKHHKLLKAAHDSATNLLGIINDLVELSRMEAEGVKPGSEVFSIRETVKSAGEMLAGKAEQKGLVMKSRVGPDVPEFAMGDSDLLLKILFRLAGNAIKFTETGYVEITAARESEDDTRIWIRFSVIDTGIGIEPEKLDRIFQDFTQADGSTTRRYGGMGLDLTLVRRLVEHMNGNIRAENAEGGGSVFTCTLPFKYLR